MKKVKFMIEDKYWRVTVFNFLFQGVLLFEYLLEARVIIFNIADRLSETDLEVVVVFVFEDASLGNVIVLD